MSGQATDPPSRSAAAEDAPDDLPVELLGELPPSFFPPPFVSSVELIEDYGREWAIEVLHSLGLTEALSGAGASREELLADDRIVPAFHTALGWLLRQLAAAGLVERSDPAGDGGTRWRLTETPLRSSRRAQLREELLAIDPANQPTVELLDAAGDAYPAVARGEKTGEEVLLSPGATVLWGRYFANDNPLYAINNLVAARAAVNRLPEAGPLRLLEVGAGGGSATRALLAELAASGRGGGLEELLVTELSPFFRRRAERALPGEFPDLPITVAALDIDRPWREQGIEPASRHLVFGVNVLHVADDLAFSLGQAYESLAPGGWLVAGECIRPHQHQAVSAEMPFQLLAEFNQVRIEPETRPAPGFMTPESWQRSLAARGFEPVELVPELTRVREVLPTFLTGAVCGRRPA